MPVLEIVSQRVEAAHEFIRGRIDLKHTRIDHVTSGMVRKKYPPHIDTRQTAENRT